MWWLIKQCKSNQGHSTYGTTDQTNRRERKFHLKLFLLITCGYQKLGSMIFETIKQRQRPHAVTGIASRTRLFVCRCRSSIVKHYISAILHGHANAVVVVVECWMLDVGCKQLCFILLVYCVVKRYYVYCNYCYHYHYFVITFLVGKKNSIWSEKRSWEETKVRQWLNCVRYWWWWWHGMSVKMEYFAHKIMRLSCRSTRLYMDISMVYVLVLAHSTHKYA